MEVIEIKTPKIPKTFLARARKMRGIKKVVNISDDLRLLTPAADTLLSQVVKLASETGMRIDSLNIAQPTLEDVFIKLTGKTLRD
jgi:ABC-2 type transport system ATP-binding protein